MRWSFISFYPEKEGLTINFGRLFTPCERTWGLLESLSDNTSDDDTGRFPKFLSGMEELFLGLVLLIS
jgi:hypothetical protein